LESAGNQHNQDKEIYEKMFIYEYKNVEDFTLQHEKFLVVL